MNKLRNIIYTKVITPSFLSPTKKEEVLHITEENNGFAVWVIDLDQNEKLVKWFKNSDRAIEGGVLLGEKLYEDKERIKALKNCVDFYD